MCMEGQDTSEYCLRRTGHAATHPNVPDVLRLKKDVTSFGRLTANDHFLDSAVLNCMISRRHAEIRCLESHQDGAEYEIIDHSLNGTYVNDKRVDGRCALHVGDVLKFGHMNGVNIKPGQHAPQPNTEFVFQFSRVSDRPKGIHIPTTNGTDTSAKLSHNKDNKNNAKRLASTSSSSSEVESPVIEKQSFTKNTGKKRKSRSSSSGSDGGSAGEEESNDGDLAGTRMFSNDSGMVDVKNSAEVSNNSSDSDEDIFESATDGSPSERKMSISPLTTDSRKQRKPSTTKAQKIQGKKKKEPSSVPPDFKKPRCAPKSMKAEVKPEDKPMPAPGTDEWWYYHSDDDKCAAPHCRRPGQHDVIDWVACDDCDQWWHTSCAGVTSQQIKKKSFQYHCGCSKKKKNR